ncbi:MAG: hypothetical protein FVQ85_13040 [Planctomycetes bacterium]|nr:hypothetical protein [Planctomycetota bacterium]
MVKKSGMVSLIFVIIFVVLAVITLPGLFSYFYRAGVGHAFFEIVQSENLEWDTMSDAERAPYSARAKAEGLKCAVLMVLGQHIPFCLLVLIIIGLLNRFISHGFRCFLRFGFFAVWILGMLFLSFGVGYWGQATPFPESLGPAFFIYLIVAALLGIILGIGRLCRRSKPPAAPQPIQKEQNQKDAKQTSPQFSESAPNSSSKTVT